MNGNRRGASLVVIAVIAAFVAGCGGANPPCKTDIATVEAARKSAADAEARLAYLEGQKKQLEESIAAEQARFDTLQQQKADLEAKLAEKTK